MPRRMILAVALVGAVSLLCWQTTQGARDQDEVMELYGLFVDAVEQVESNYVRPVNRRELFENAINGMLSELDPYSSYYNSSQLRQFNRQIEGSFGGIGITVNVDPGSGRLKVVAPMVGTPAYRAGILAGDLILEIDGQSTEGIRIDKAVDLLQGRTGTSVTMKVLHPRNPKPVDVTITRATIELPSVLGDIRKPDDTWDYMFDKENKIGYVRVTSFIRRTAEELKKALDELKSQGMRGLVLDLRDNPGGLLSAAVEISDLFVEDGVIVSTKGRNTVDKVFKAKKDATFTGFPMAVLVNGGSASASEIVSACLQDDNRAEIIGQRSFGKGSVQNIIELEDGNSVLKLTVQTYHRRSGKNIHRFKNAKESDDWGVLPNPGLEVKLTSDQYVSWALARRDRDLLSSANPPSQDPKAKDESKDQNEKKDPSAKTDQPEKKDPSEKKDGAGREPGKIPALKDLQLEKALSVVREKLKAADAKDKDKDKGEAKPATDGQSKAEKA